MPSEPRFLDNESKGRWIVVTQTSTYFLDLDNRTAIRIPNKKSENVEGYDIASLRKDGEMWNVATILKCVVGKNLELKTTGTHKKLKVMTLRRSTPVVSITRI